ncbi:DUF2589 domain-containing protein [Algoriphagus sediminis]|uniref:DUF2589 domain-containing protein n=1 Tax=Algoriphagus sediminis TaxID=3057113 RepID=A0ABT7YEV3_9BACT|nr:DUF2589 domain-containing protein [Algoriphagus sediminis]MDN3205033.1 DUF2589 domain-containing protein [Algoriphagus sediminis]
MITPKYISDLLGAPMAAVVQAEAIAAKATAEFIQEVGFSKSEVNEDGNFGTVRNVTFSYNRIEADGQTRMTNISVPLLTVIPIPSLKVAEAEIEFDLALSQPNSSTEGGESSSGKDRRSPFLSRSLRLKAIIGKKAQEGKANTTNSATANMNVKIRLAQAEPTIGMVQLLNILDNADKEN